MIVVFGATGTVGGHVLGALRAQGAPVRAVARSQHKADALADDGVQAVVADITDPTGLQDALRGADHVFLATPASAGQVALEGTVVDALAGTSAHLVKLAALGYDAVPADEGIALAANHARVVEHARQVGVALTVLAPTGFMTNLLGSAGTVAQGTLPGSAGDGGTAWIDPADVGAVAAHVLTTPGHEGRSYDLTGPEVLTHAQLAERLSAALGREVRYVDVPPPQFTAALQSAGLDAWLAAALTELQQLYRAHAAEVVTDEVRKATGRDARTVDDWLAEHRAAFTG